MTTEPFKENVQSYCSRILADCEQLRYIIQTMKFSGDDHIKHHCNNAFEYVNKIQEHLDAIEKLPQT